MQQRGEPPTGKLDRAALDYRENGYASIRGVVSPELIEEISQHVEWLISKYPGLHPEHLSHPLIGNDACWVRMTLEPELLDIGERFLRAALTYFTARYTWKPAVDGPAVLWHQDGVYWKLDPLEAPARAALVRAERLGQAPLRARHRLLLHCHPHPSATVSTSTLPPRRALPCPTSTPR